MGITETSDMKSAESNDLVYVKMSCLGFTEVLSGY
jgi:hypothetical protein